MKKTIIIFILMTSFVFFLRFGKSVNACNLCWSEDVWAMMCCPDAVDPGQVDACAGNTNCGVCGNPACAGPDPCAGNTNCGECGNPACPGGGGGPDPCAGNTNCGECGNPACCSPSCGSPLCGQGDGCGGGCSSADNYWTWGACQYGTFQRTQTNACAGSSSEACLGTISGNLFNASDIDVCPVSMVELAISGAVATASSSTIDYSAVADANGFYTTSVRIPDTYNMTFAPKGRFVPTPKLNCQGSSVSFTSQGETATRDFGFWRIYGGWWQVVNGSAYGGTGIKSTIPGTMPALSRHIILANASGTDGLAYYKSGSLDMGTYPNLTVSETGYQVNSGYAGDVANYNYFKIKMATYDKTVWDGLSQPIYNSGANDYEIYTHTGDVTINWSPNAGEKVIYLINGNVTVSGNVTVPTASPTFLAVFANGTITFNSDVTAVDGWWVGNSLNFPCVDSAPTDSICDQTDVQFVGQGSFIGYDGITFSRDQDILNNSQPAEKFIYRPDLIINAPDPVLVSRYVWRQL